MTEELNLNDHVSPERQDMIINDLVKFCADRNLSPFETLYAIGVLEAGLELMAKQSLDSRSIARISKRG